MSKREICQLTDRDFVVLQNLVMSRCLANPRIQKLLCDKLASAAVLAPGEIPLQVVTLDSRVCFRRDGRVPETRIVSVSDQNHPLGAVLSVATPLGLGLLGRRCGDTVTANGMEGQETRAEIVAVLYQPEAAERQLRRA